MRILSSTIGCFLLATIVTFVFGCSRPALYVGVGGKYNEAKEEITRRRGGNPDKAIANLEAVVGENPMYQDSLTLLGRAYYMKGRYRDAFQILERAVTVNKEDEIAWLVLGMTQLRLGEDDKGLETVQGGLTIFSRVSVSGYRGYLYWDRAGRVKSALRRTVTVVRKGLEEKENLVRSVENMLAAVDEEEWNLRLEAGLDRRRDLGR